MGQRLEALRLGSLIERGQDGINLLVALPPLGGGQVSLQRRGAFQLVLLAQVAVLVGDPTKPGFYAVYNKWTKGNHFSHPHFHPNDRYIVVLQGTWWVGSGPKFDPENGTTPLPAGSFVTHFGKQVHWDGAKDEDAVLLIMGEGPATATEVTEEK